MPRKIYLASSWRNPMQPVALKMLRGEGHTVYDFRNPAPGNTGFAWSEIDPDWLAWTPEHLIESFRHPLAINGFGHDYNAMRKCDTGVLLLPSGRSAHIEAGWLLGAGKPTVIVLHPDKFEPELMYMLAGPGRIVPDLKGMLNAVNEIDNDTKCPLSPARSCHVDDFEPIAMMHWRGRD